MSLMHKKIAGLGLILIGGLIAAHGAVIEVTWETVLGLLMLVAGTALLALKVVRRNMHDEGRAHS